MDKLGTKLWIKTVDNFAEFLGYPQLFEEKCRSSRVYPQKTVDNPVDNVDNSVLLPGLHNIHKSHIYSYLLRKKHWI